MIKVYFPSLSYSNQPVTLVKMAIFLAPPPAGINNVHDMHKVILPFSPFEEVKRQILELSDLQANWDGYGAVPVHPEIVELACKFITVLDSEHIELINDCFANPNGTITIEFCNSNGEKLQLEIGLDNFSYFAKHNNKPLVTVNDQNLFSNIKTIKEHLDQIAAKTAPIYLLH